MIKILGIVINERVILCDCGIIYTICQVLFLNPQHLHTAIPNLLLIKPALLQMFYEIWMIPLESSQQILDELAPAVLDLLQLLESVNAYIFSLVHSMSSQLNFAESYIAYCSS